MVIDTGLLVEQKSRFLIFPVYVTKLLPPKSADSTLITTSWIFVVDLEVNDVQPPGKPGVKE